jgi:hypothetical protein
MPSHGSSRRPGMPRLYYVRCPPYFPSVHSFTLKAQRKENLQDGWNSRNVVSFESGIQYDLATTGLLSCPC